MPAGGGGTAAGGVHRAAKGPAQHRLVLGGCAVGDYRSVARERLVRAAPRKIKVAMAVLMALVFSKYIYLASLTSYYTFFLISKFHVPVRSAQIHLFLFLGAVAAGTVAGGVIGDRFGRKYAIWCSILGVLPASAFSAILVYA